MNAEEWRNHKHNVYMKNAALILEKRYIIQREEIELFLATGQRTFQPTVFNKLPDNICDELKARGYNLKVEVNNANTTYEFTTYIFE